MHVRIFLFEISKFKVLTTTHNDESFISSVYFNGVATSPFVALISLSLNNIERDQEAIIHGSIAPVTISPRQPPGNVYSFRPAAGGFLQTVLFPVAGGGAIETIYSSSLRSTSLHGPRGEVLPGKMPRICCSLVRIE